MPSSAYTVQLPVFAGPLDLLLQLIEREELDITKVSLAQVTDQFLEYIKVLEHLNIGDLADFLAIAARLILIKSEALLPRPVERLPGEEDPGDELARQLLAYKKYKQIAGLLKEREDANLRTYLRLAPPPKVETKLDISKLTTLDLLEAVRRALALTPDKPALETVVAPPKVTIRDQIRQIAGALRRQNGRASFRNCWKAPPAAWKLSSRSWPSWSSSSAARSKPGRSRCSVKLSWWLSRSGRTTKPRWPNSSSNEGPDGDARRSSAGINQHIHQRRVAAAHKPLMEFIGGGEEGSPCQG